MLAIESIEYESDQTKKSKPNEIFKKPAKYI